MISFLNDVFVVYKEVLGGRLLARKKFIDECKMQRSLSVFLFGKKLLFTTIIV